MNRNEQIFTNLGLFLFIATKYTLNNWHIILILGSVIKLSLWSYNSTL